MPMNAEIAKLLSRILDPEDLGLSATPGLRDIARFALGMPIVESDLVAYFGQAQMHMPPSKQQDYELLRKAYNRAIRDAASLINNNPREGKNGTISQIKSLYLREEEFCDHLWSYFGDQQNPRCWRCDKVGTQLDLQRAPATSILR